MNSLNSHTQGISIVIVNWNGLKWLDKLLKSLEKQTFKNFEVILVDNASTDSSVQFIQSKFPAVKLVISKKNLGFAGGNNLGIKHASKDYILLLNNDTWIKPNFLQKIYDYKLKSGLDVVGPQEASYEGATKNSCVTTIDFLGHPVYLRKDHPGKQNMYLSGVCILFKKDLYLETKGLDGNFFMYFEEIDWFWRLKIMDKTFGYDKDISVYHAGAGSGTNDSLKYNSFLWRNENTLQMLLKNYSAMTLLPIIPLYILQNILEMAVFAVIKPQIAKTYFLGWKFNIKNFKRTMKSRKIVQNMRTVSDIQVMRTMYKGPGKLHHLIEFLKSKVVNAKTTSE